MENDIFVTVHNGNDKVAIRISDIRTCFVKDSRIEITFCDKSTCSLICASAELADKVFETIFQKVGKVIC